MYPRRLIIKINYIAPCYIVADSQFWCIMVNIDKVDGNEKTIAGKKDLKARFT